jgi:hypothetical protein
MAQLNLELPAYFALKFISPVGGKHRVADSNTFQIELAGNCCDIILDAYLASMLPVQSMTCGLVAAIGVLVCWQIGVPDAVGGYSSGEGD